MRQFAQTQKYIQRSAPFDQTFLKDCHDFFSKNKSGGMGNWRYEDGVENDPAAGAALWERLVEKATTYYVSRAGDQSVIQNLDRISEYIGGNSNMLVDLGPGKVRAAKRQLIEALAKNGIYAPVDISTKFLDEGVQLKQEGIAAEVLPITADFTVDVLNLPDKGKRVFVFLGSTIGNIKAGFNKDPEPYVLGILKKIKRQMRKGDSLIVGFDSSFDGKAVLECYEDPYSVDVMLAPLFKIKRDLPHKGNFDPTKYKASFLWFPQTGQCAHTVIAQEDQVIAFDNRVYQIRAGQRLHISNSYKFTTEAMNAFFSKVGLSDVLTLGNKENPMKLTLGRI